MTPEKGDRLINEDGVEDILGPDDGITSHGQSGNMNLSQVNNILLADARAKGV